MIQKLKITQECLFLHETPMADLEKEQLFLRTLLGAMKPPPSLPFNILPPLCIISLGAIPGKLEVAAPKNCNGWIIREINTSRSSTEMQQITLASETSFPLFPSLPQKACFILGYAGTEADPLIAQMSESRPFSVKVFYYAQLSASIEWEEGQLYSVTYEIGEAHWHKVSQ